jgi:hypothetical protein
MNEAGFWEIIQRCHDAAAGDMDQKCELVRRELTALPKDDATDFFHYFDQTMDRAYSWPLWGAAFVINGGCSDDTFSDFCSSLISRGRAAFEKAMADPDSLADEQIVESSWFFEGFQYAVHEGVEANLGHRPARWAPPPRTPSGSEWQEENVYDLFPRLAAKTRWPPR